MGRRLLNIVAPLPKFVALSGIVVGLSGVLGCEHYHEYREVRVREEPPPPPPPPAQVVIADPPPPVYTPPPQEVVTVYDQELTPYGRWVAVAPYGRCWVPNDRPADWEPYRVGHWVYTDEGWCWVAEADEVAWATSVTTTDDGFVILRGLVLGTGLGLAPSWCAWREGGGYCGWAPLPPQCPDNAAINVAIVNRYCPPSSFHYCDERFVSEPRVYQHFERNVTVINKTTNITNITYVNNRVVNRGVRVKDVETRSGLRIEKVTVTRATNVDEARKLVGEGRPVAYTPPAIEHFNQAHPPHVVRGAQPAAVDQKTRLQQQAAERARAERDNAQRLQQDRAANDRLAQQRATEERATAERANQERAAQEKANRERANQERANQERANQERANQERANQERANQERANQERAKQDRAKQDRVNQERATQERANRDHAAQQQRDAEKAARDKAAQDRTRQDRTGQSQQRNGQEHPADEKQQSKQKGDEPGQDRGGPR